MCELHADLQLQLVPRPAEVLGWVTSAFSLAGDVPVARTALCAAGPISAVAEGFLVAFPFLCDAGSGSRSVVWWWPDLRAQVGGAASQGWGSVPGRWCGAGTAVGWMDADVSGIWVGSTPCWGWDFDQIEFRSQTSRDCDAPGRGDSP